MAVSSSPTWTRSLLQLGRTMKWSFTYFSATQHATFYYSGRPWGSLLQRGRGKDGLSTAGCPRHFLPDTHDHDSFMGTESMASPWRSYQHYTCPERLAIPAQVSTHTTVWPEPFLTGIFDYPAQRDNHTAATLNDLDQCLLSGALRERTCDFEGNNALLGRFVDNGPTSKLRWGQPWAQAPLCCLEWTQSRQARLQSSRGA